MKRALCLHAMILLTFVGWPAIIGGPILTFLWIESLVTRAGLQAGAIYGVPAAIGAALLWAVALYAYVYRCVSDNDSDLALTCFCLGWAVGLWPLTLAILMGFGIYHFLFHPAMEWLDARRDQPSSSPWVPQQQDDWEATSPPEPVHAWDDPRPEVDYSPFVPGDEEPVDEVVTEAIASELDDEDEYLVLPPGPEEWDE